GWFFNRIAAFAGRPISEWQRVVFVSLGVLAAAYILKESLNFLRRWIVTRTTTAIERHMTVRLVGHLLKVDLGALAPEGFGSLHVRISRFVDGYVKFLRVGFSDFVPAILTALFALGAAIQQEWRVGLIMLCVVPISLLITLRQVNSQKGIRASLLQAKEG